MRNDCWHLEYGLAWFTDFATPKAQGEDELHPLSLKNFIDNVKENYIHWDTNDKVFRFAVEDAQELVIPVNKLYVVVHIWQGF